MPLRFSLRQLEYLVAVGEAGSIAQAAERVNVSSPSISAAISQLEEAFGLPFRAPPRPWAVADAGGSSLSNRPSWCWPRPRD
ncbi:LysR family transcriptional regulator [Gemmobacter lanyuensis]